MNEKIKTLLSIVTDYVIDFIIFFIALSLTDKLPLHALLEVLLGAIVAFAIIVLKENLAMKFLRKKNCKEETANESTATVAETATTAEASAPTENTTTSDASSATDASNAEEKATTDATSDTTTT